MRYPLLFQRILENLPPDHPHRPRVLMALQIVDKISREVDEYKARRDKELRMVQIYHMLGAVVEVLAPVFVLLERFIALADFSHLIAAVTIALLTNFTELFCRSLLAVILVCMSS